MTLLNHKSIIAGLSLILLFLSAQDNTTYARKIKTKRPVSKSLAATKKDNAAETSRYIYENDSTQNFGRIINHINFYGFDKTANSSVESFFISNSLDSTLTHLTIDITYLDMKGRQLHRREVDFNCDIPPGETRRQDIKSWDNQKSFYFHQSARPHRQSTPFKVTIKLKGAVLLPSLTTEETIIDKSVKAVTP